MSGVERIAEAFAASGKRAALMPYLMGGFPDLATSRAIGEAYADAGADLVELGVPFSDPLADGPVIHAADTAALAAGTTIADVLELGQALAPRVAVVLMCYANPIYARGFDAFAQALSDHAISGLIVPDLPLEEAPALREACEQGGIALVPLVAVSSTRCRSSARRASAARSTRAWRTSCAARPLPPARCRSRSASGSRRPSTRRPRPTRGRPA